VQKKRMWRLMRAPHLLVPPNGRLKAKRTPTRRKPQPTKPDEGWGIDMTKVLVEGLGWVSIVVVLDGSTKQIVGYEVGLRSTTQQGLAALDRAVKRQVLDGARGPGLSLMRDPGCQPTSMAFRPAWNLLGIHQVLTSDNNPKGNADTARVMRTLKAEGLWLHEWTSPVTSARARGRWLDDDNAHDLHSALRYKPPRQFARADHGSHGTQSPAA
jgi:putative transposase